MEFVSVCVIDFWNDDTIYSFGILSHFHYYLINCTLFQLEYILFKRKIDPSAKILGVGTQIEVVG